MASDLAQVVVRTADVSETSFLTELEKKAWGDLAIDETTLKERLINFPDGQFVAVLHGVVVGAIYTQRVPSVDALLSSSFATQQSLHDSHGPVFQLLGVAVASEYAHLQIGNLLRNHAISFAVTNAVTEVVAMTRCAMPSSSLFTYLQKVQTADDPILHFHQSAGATVVAAMHNYRPNDRVNFGHAVLVHYTQETITRISNQYHAGRQASLVANPVVGQLSEEQLCAMINRITRQEHALDDHFLRSPFLSLGLDSLSLLELRTSLQQVMGVEVSPTVFFEFPTPLQLIKHFKGTSPLTSAPRSVPQAQKEDILITGVSCRLPGGAHDPQSLFELLRAKKQTAQPLPDSWKAHCSVPAASFLDDDVAETFDPSFFGLSAAEAAIMDPHQRLLLEVVHEALVDAGLLKENTVSGADRVGVFVGLCNHDWLRMDNGQPSPYSSTGLAPSSCANRISFLYHLSGPSVVVDTACSSSLTALHVAHQSIQQGDCDVAVVASVDLLLSPFSLQIREASQMLTKSGLNRSFGAQADGYVRGEGAVAIVLSRQTVAPSTAQQGCYAKILGSAVNQDGKSASFTAPNGSAQRQLLQSALASAGLRPEDVAGIECHGTGTALGDPIEYEAIRQVYLQHPSDKPLTIGAIKSNIGHLEGAAGLAGVLKAILSVHHEEIPPSLHNEVLNPLIAETLHKNQRPALFPRQSVPISAEAILGISSFGSGGSNAHVLIQGVAPSFRRSTSIVDAPASERRKLAVLFAGQGKYSAETYKVMFQSSLAFQTVVKLIAAEWQAGRDFLSALQAPMKDSASRKHLTQTTCRHLLLFSLQMLQLQQLRAESSIPEIYACLGHSLGEFAVAVTVGVMTVQQAVHLIVERARLLDIQRSKLPPCTMVAVRVPRADVEKALRSLPALSVAIGVENARDSVALSGPRASLEVVINKLQCSHRFLDLDLPYHNPLILDAAKAFGNYVDEYFAKSPLPAEQRSATRFWSCLTGQEEAVDKLRQGSYWRQQMVGTVLFWPMVQQLDEHCQTQGVQLVLVEVGVDDSLTKLAQRGQDASSRKRLCMVALHSNEQADVETADLQPVLHLLNSTASRGGRFDPTYQPELFAWRNLGIPNNPLRLSLEMQPLQELQQAQAANLFEVVKEIIRRFTVVQHSSVSWQDTTSLLALGVDSLSAVAIRNALSTRLRLPHLPLTIVMQCSTIGQLLRYLQEHLDDATSHPPTISRTEASEVTSCSPVSEPQDDSGDEAATVEGGDRPLQFPLSSLQTTMLMHCLAHPEWSSFLETFVWHVPAGQPVDTSALLLAWKALIAHYPILRTEFDPVSTGSAAVQTVVPVNKIPSLKPDVQRVNWFTTEKKSGSSTDDVVRDQRRSILGDFSVPLLRVAVVPSPSSTQQSSLVVTLHHLLIDGVAMGLLLRDLGKLYALYRSGKQGITVPRSFFAGSRAFADVVHVEQQLVRAPAQHPYRVYWSSVVERIVEVSKAQVIRRVPMDFSDERVIREKVVVPEGFSHVTAFAQRVHLPVASLYHALFSIFLTVLPVESLSLPHAAVYGSTMLGRRSMVGATSVSEHSIVGPLVNTVPIVHDIVETACLEEFAEAVHLCLVNAVEHSALPLMEIQRRSGQPSLFPVIFDVQRNSWNITLDSTAQVQATFHALIDRIGFPLSMRVLLEEQGGVTLACTSESSRYDLSIVRYLLAAFRHFLGEIAPLLQSTDKGLHQIKALQACVPGKPSSLRTWSEEFPLGHQHDSDLVETVALPATINDESIIAGCLLALSKYSARRSALLRVRQGEGDRVVVYNFDEQDTELRRLLSKVDLLYRMSAAEEQTIAPCLTFGDGPRVTLDDKNPLVLSVSRQLKQIRLTARAVPVSTLTALSKTLTGILSAAQRGERLPLPSTEETFLAAAQPYQPNVSYPRDFLDSAITDKTLFTARRQSVAIVQDSIDGQTSITYEQLRKVAAWIAGSIPTDNSLDEIIIAVIMEKGWEQVAAVLAILQIDAAYLPMDARTWPEQRIRQVLSLSGAQAVVSQRSLVCGSESRCGWLETVASELSLPLVLVGERELAVSESDAEESARAVARCLADRPERSDESLAYLIYTSGSTGVPKGVRCHHRGAVNTIQDLNESFGIGSADRVLGLSSLSFDLSVYDIFGLSTTTTTESPSIHLCN